VGVRSGRARGKGQFEPLFDLLSVIGIESLKGGIERAVRNDKRFLPFFCQPSPREDRVDEEDDQDDPTSKQPKGPLVLLRCPDLRHVKR
jgi:hypothetical protein